MTTKCEGCGRELKDDEIVIEVGREWFYCLHPCAVIMKARYVDMIINEPIDYALA